MPIKVLRFVDIAAPQEKLFCVLQFVIKIKRSTNGRNMQRGKSHGVLERPMEMMTIPKLLTKGVI